MTTILVAAAAILFVAGLIGLVVIYKLFLHVARPSEVLIYSGRDYRDAQGRKTSYKVLFGGRRWANPLWEKVDRLDLTVMPVHINITGAYSKGGIPLNVQAVANVKIDSNEQRIHNAIERFLGRGRNEVLRVAQETLEGNLRGVLATLTPEEVNDDRLKFAERLAEAAELDLGRLGLHLDTLKIQNVFDDRDYLDSIGRRRIAEIIKVAEVAESNALKMAEEVEAEAQGRGEVARRNAQAQIQKAQNALRQLQAQLEQEAKSEEERATARALAARAEAEQELQQVRTELEKIRLQADVVIPAEADKVARELMAAGEAADIAERGKAMAEVLRMMSDVWQEAGDAAMDVFIIQRIESIMERVSAAARQVQVREVALIDNGSGQSIPNYVGAFPAIVGNIFEQMRDTLGIDVGGVMTGEHAVSHKNGTNASAAGGEKYAIESSLPKRIEQQGGESVSSGQSSTATQFGNE